MREYRIYMQRTKCAEGHFKWIVYKWLPWEYVGCVEGTKELYTYFKLKFPYSMRSINFYHSFNYFDDEYLKIDNNHGNVRDFHQLTKKYKKKYYRTYHKHHGWNIHRASTESDQRKSITPEEIKEIKYEYGITLKPIKPKRKTDSWDHVRGSKVSGWKMQSKRKKQWR